MARTPKSGGERSSPAEFDYRGIDDVIHGRVRLAIMAYLSAAGSANFNELKAKVGGTDGNLSVHIRKLEEATYLAVEKKFANRRPLTICSLTNRGRKAWLAYIGQMEALIGMKAAE